GREAQLYLAVLSLPLRGPSGRVRFRPLYYAGVDTKSGRPRWTHSEAQAKPLALDGVVGGSPHEEQHIVNQEAVAWIGEPVHKWMLLYGGDAADYSLLDPANARPNGAPGSIRMRFADQPWGPWTPPIPHLLQGSPSVPGDLYGPGGILYHFLCQDQGALHCARSDPTRPPQVVNPDCAPFAVQFDIGFLYGANIIDPWTRPDGVGGVDVHWNVSTWNPYSVFLLRTNVRPR